MTKKKAPKTFITLRRRADAKLGIAYSLIERVLDGENLYRKQRTRLRNALGHIEKTLADLDAFAEMEPEDVKSMKEDFRDDLIDAISSWSFNGQVK